MAYRIVHRTSYRYESVVSASYGIVTLLPRPTDTQVVRESRIEISPMPGSYLERTDFFGNRVAQFSIVQEHIDLTVTATSVVDVGPRLVPPSGSGPSWEQARDLVASSLEPMELDARSFVLDSPSVPLTDAVRAYASTSFTVGRPLVDVLSDLTLRIHADFEYEPGATDLQTTPDEALLLRKGVCQDFAHLQVACLRSFGIAARYVSGYLETIAPPGQPKLLGADVSHAWVSAFLPSFGWVDVDPTNNLFVGDRHVTTSWGRDYADVSPLKGVIYTEATTNLMTVSVDVTSQP